MVAAMAALHDDSFLARLRVTSSASFDWLVSNGASTAACPLPFYASDLIHAKALTARSMQVEEQGTDVAPDASQYTCHQLQVLVATPCDLRVRGLTELKAKLRTGSVVVRDGTRRLLLKLGSDEGFQLHELHPFPSLAMGIFPFPPWDSPEVDLRHEVSRTQSGIPPSPQKLLSAPPPPFPLHTHTPLCPVFAQTAELMMYEYGMTLCREAVRDEAAGKLSSSLGLYESALALFEVLMEAASGEVGPFLAVMVAWCVFWGSDV
jgi:hypothetical protein